MHNGWPVAKMTSVFIQPKNLLHLAEWFFDRWGKDESSLLDLYSAAQAPPSSPARKTHRHCRMMELDPAYCDVIVKRWEDFTGNTAVLELPEKV